MRLLIVTIIIKKGRIITLLELDATLPLIFLNAQIFNS